VKAGQPQDNWRNLRPALAIIDSDLRIKLSMAEPNVLAHSVQQLIHIKVRSKAGQRLGQGRLGHWP